MTFRRPRPYEFGGVIGEDSPLRDLDENGTNSRLYRLLMNSSEDSSDQVEPTFVARNGTAVWRVHTAGEPYETLITAHDGEVELGIFDPSENKLVPPSAKDLAMVFTAAEICDVLPSLHAALYHAKQEQA